MLSKGRKMWIRWLLMIAILISGCGPPITTRLVSIDLEKESEADIQSLRTIGVLPLSSPDPDVGTRMAGELANSLDSGLLGQGPFVARVIRPPKDFKLEEPHDHCDLLLHRGDFGLEPCSYVVGTDAIDVAKKVMRLLEEYPCP